MAQSSGTVCRSTQVDTVKRYDRADGGTIELTPVSSSDEHETIRIVPDTDDFEIIGTVVGAIIGTR